MNTDCGKCIFNNNHKCKFNIPKLLSGQYIINKKDNNNYIENYKCSYAFSTDIFDQHKQDLPDDMSEFMKYKNKLDYYMIWDCDNLTATQIIENYTTYISHMHTLPTKLSIICQFESKLETQILVEFLQNNLSMPWKLHNLLLQQTDKNKLFDILNTNLVNNINSIWFIKNNDLDRLNDELNYINFLSKILKPKYAAIRKNDDDLDGLFIAVENLKLIKN